MRNPEESLSIVAASESKPSPERGGGQPANRRPLPPRGSPCDFNHRPVWGPGSPRSAHRPGPHSRPRTTPHPRGTCWIELCRRQRPGRAVPGCAEAPGGDGVRGVRHSGRRRRWRYRGFGRRSPCFDALRWSGHPRPGRRPTGLSAASRDDAGAGRGADGQLPYRSPPAAPRGRPTAWPFGAGAPGRRGSWLGGDSTRPRRGRRDAVWYCLRCEAPTAARSGHAASHRLPHAGLGSRSPAADRRPRSRFDSRPARRGGLGARLPLAGPGWTPGVFRLCQSRLRPQTQLASRVVATGSSSPLGALAADERQPDGIRSQPGPLVW